jgi:peptidoglycan glycosyltransferase
MLLMFGLALLLLGWQQDLGAALLFYLTFLAMLYLAWGRPLHVALGLFLFTPVAVVGHYLSARVALRLSIWLNPWTPEQADRAFQILQSLFALASGGILGQGLGQGNPTFIPVVHSDFVYAALLEEFGMLGAIGCIALMGLLIVRGMQIAQRAESPFESLLAGGIAALLGLQSCVIIAGTTKLMPLTGVTLPFLSYGGSSLLTTMIAVGLWLNLSASQRPTLSLTLNTNAAPSLRKTTGQLGQALIVLLSIIALGSGYWAVIRRDDLRDYATNPRHLLAEARIRRGRIMDRANTALADVHVDEDGFVTRTYPVPEAAPVVGYTTVQYGNAGIEQTCNAVLRGDIKPDNTRSIRTPTEILRDELLDRATTGYSVKLTLDAELQQLTQHLLADRRGAILLVDAHTGDILAMGSAPIYASAQVAEMWDTLRDDPQSPLLNRATQDLAQPGAALETVILGTALQSSTLGPSIAIQPPPVHVDTPIRVDGITLTCTTKPEAETWEAALASACPAPFVALATTLGRETLVQGYEDWGLITAPPLALPTVASDWDVKDADLIAEATGQGDLLVTPIQMVGIAATLANNGARPPLHLLAESTPGCRGTRSTEEVRIVPPEIAQTLRAMWPNWGPEITGHLSTALAGPARTIAWFIGIGPWQAPRYAVAVMLESPEDPKDAGEIGQVLIQEAIGP